MYACMHVYIKCAYKYIYNMYVNIYNVYVNMYIMFTYTHIYTHIWQERVDSAGTFSTEASSQLQTSASITARKQSSNHSYNFNGSPAR